MRRSSLEGIFRSFAPVALLIALLVGAYGAGQCQTFAKRSFVSVNTYLFQHTAPPEGFEPVEGNPGIYRFAGKHPAVYGNGRAKIGDVMTALVVLRAESCRGGNYTLWDQAGIVIHEQFHAFQKEKHPSWRSNDAFLLVYSLDTVESLTLRYLMTGENPAANTLLVYRADAMVLDRVSFEKRPECPVCGKAAR